MKRPARAIGDREETKFCTRKSRLRSSTQRGICLYVYTTSSEPFLLTYRSIFVRLAYRDSSDVAEEGQSMILAGDIGGTKTILTALDEQGAFGDAVCEETYASREFEGLERMVADFLAKHRIEPRL